MRQKLRRKNNRSISGMQIDIDDKTIVAVHISTTRTAFDAYYFLKMLLETCVNSPLIMVNRRTRYRQTLQRLGLDYRHETFGERFPIEQWYSQFKAKVKRFWKRFPYRSTLGSIKRWCKVWISMYNLFLKVP